VRGRRRRSTPRRAAPTIPPGGVGTAGKGPAARTRNPILRFFAILGPGLITGASDDDPSGIGTYAVAGASFGFATLWTALLTFPMMTAVQLTCAKIGMVTGMGLARVLRQHYPRALLYPVVGALVIANTMNAGADIGAMAEAVNLLVPVPPRALIVPIALAILALQVWGSYQLISRVFKWLSLALLAYIGSALYARPDAGAVLRGTFVPTIHFDARFISTLVALLGTTISPYLFFWQASEEVEEEISMGRRTLASRQGATDRELRYAGIDVTAGMFFSNLVMYFIILATAATLFQAGKTEIGSATEAAQALRPTGRQCSSRASRDRAHRSWLPGGPGPHGIERVRDGRGNGLETRSERETATSEAILRHDCRADAGRDVHQLRRDQSHQCLILERCAQRPHRSADPGCRDAGCEQSARYGQTRECALEQRGWVGDDRPDGAGRGRAPCGAVSGRSSHHD